MQVHRPEPRQTRSIRLSVCLYTTLSTAITIPLRVVCIIIFPDWRRGDQVQDAHWAEEPEVISSSRAHSLFFALRNNFAVIWRLKRGAVQARSPLLLLFSPVLSAAYKSLSWTAGTAFFVSVAHFLLKEKERITGLAAVFSTTDWPSLRNPKGLFFLSRIQRNKKKWRMMMVEFPFSDKQQGISIIIIKQRPGGFLGINKMQLKSSSFSPLTECPNSNSILSGEN